MIAYIKLSTLEYPRHEGDIRLEHPEIPESQTSPNFPCPPTYAPVKPTDPPAFDPTRQRAELVTPEQLPDGTWEARWRVAAIPESEVAGYIRMDRNQRLAECDWTQLADSPVDKAAWASYRQALRDIPQQAGFPWTFTWPTKPA
jgi:hypothetical protein